MVELSALTLYSLCTPRHMIDLSEEPMEENIGICVDYLTRMTKMGARLTRTSSCHHVPRGCHTKHSRLPTYKALLTRHYLQGATYKACMLLETVLLTTCALLTT